MSKTVALFTDFGLNGPYVGLLKLALLRYGSGLQLIDLCHDAPVFDPQSSAYLLAACATDFLEDTVFLGVIDPGVGGPRSGLMLRADERWYIGPDNGLFDCVAKRAERLEAWRITWRPERLSHSFHGRDVFAPVAAWLASESVGPEALGVQIRFVTRDWPNDLARVVYVDDYGNAMTGMRGQAVGTGVGILVGQQTLSWARTFSEVAPGQGFWYENSIGLVELAVNQGSAAARYGLKPNSPVQLIGDPKHSLWKP